MYLQLCTCMSVVQMEKAHLSLARIGIQRPFPVVLRQDMQGITQSLLDDFDGVCLCCKAEVICVNKPPDVVEGWLIICVYIEEGGRQNRSLGQSIFVFFSIGSLYHPSQQRTYD